MSEFSFKDYPAEFYKKVDAETVAFELIKIQNKYGHLKPSYVIEEAQHKDHPLHECFEWSDTMAARKWREEQAKSMLRVIVIKTEYMKEPLRAFVSYKNKDRENVYANIEVAFSDEITRDKIIKRALKELEMWKRRYQQYKELAEYFEALEKVVNKVA
jgi:predicted amidophosphoribosyltransferase